MVLLYVRNSQHVTLFHPEGRFLNFSDETGKFLFGTIQKKPKPERGDLEIIKMVKCTQFLVFDDRGDNFVLDCQYTLLRIIKKYTRLRIRINSAIQATRENLIESALELSYGY